MERLSGSVIVLVMLLTLAAQPIGNLTAQTLEAGFPADFPPITDTGGMGEGELLGGFGGIRVKAPGDNRSLQQINRQALQHTPVILLHGNGAHALHEPSWWSFIPAMGMHQVRELLMIKGYSDAEIWAPSYLGSNPRIAQLTTPVTDNLPDVRKFIDQVIEYLGVEKVDIVAHSLGNNMAMGYLKGFQSDNSWDNDQHRLNRVGTYVSLSAGHYGLLTTGENGYDRGSVFEVGTHIFKGITDDTPCGPSTVSEMNSEDPAWNKTSALDGTDTCERIYYVAIRSKKDLVEAQHNYTGRLEGADMNRGYRLVKWCPICKLRKHGEIISNEAVFEDYFPYFNKYPPRGLMTGLR